MVQRSHRKLVVIGIDGLDPHLLSLWHNFVPNFSILAADGLSLPMNSVFPPDSFPAWPTIYTGLDPSQHGILAHIDFLHKVDGQQVQTDSIRGNTFWDRASAAGRRVCILNPFLAYPAWPVNGIMVSGPSLTKGLPTSYPSSIASEHEIPELGGIDDFPSRVELDKILDHSKAATKELVHFGISLMKAKDWDLFFICLLTLDRVEHFFWRFWDSTDPSYPGPNRFKDAIRDFYALIDESFGEICANVASDVAILVVSDHGHRRRPTKLVNMNEVLRQEGLLEAKGRIGPWILEKTRSTILNLTRHTGTESLLFKLGRHLPKASEVRKSKLSVDTSNSMAVFSDFGGSSSFGGIRLNQVAIEKAGLQRQQLVDRIMAKLHSLSEPETGNKLVRECYPREQIYNGPFKERFPDILFALDPEYGLHWSIYDDLIIADYAHKLVSGGHSRDAVFLLSGAGNKKPRKSSAELVDIAPTILDVLGVEYDQDAMAGQALLS